MKRFALLASVVLIVDQFTKYLILRFLELGASYPLIGDFVRITHVRNPFGIFGISLGGRIPILPLTAVAIIVLIIISVRHRRFPVAFAFILGGAVGNALDRVRLRAVVDFVDMGIGKVRWPVWNVADAAITIGIIILIIQILVKPKTLESPW